MVDLDLWTSSLEKTSLSNACSPIEESLYKLLASGIGIEHTHTEMCRSFLKCPPYGRRITYTAH